MPETREPFTVFRGIGASVTVQLVDGDGNDLVNVFLGTEPINAKAWPGDNEEQSFPIEVAWNNAILGTVDLTVPAGSTDDQSEGIYQWIITLSDSSKTLARGQLIISGYPGIGMSGAVDLTSLSYIQLALSGMSLSQPQIDYLPFAVQTASAMFRKQCNRNFNRAVYTQYDVPSLEGQVMLGEIPVNTVVRISSNLDTAVRVTASESLYQIAYISYLSSGDYEGSSSPQVYTGVKLHSVSNGVSASPSLLFSAYPTIGSLVNAINAIAGWRAEVEDPRYLAWPTSEIYCQDSGSGAVSGSSVEFRVFTEDVRARIDHRTGLLTLNRGARSGGFGYRWGPDAGAFDYPSHADGYSVIRVMYDAGFDVIPAIVQQGTAELTKAILDRFVSDYMLKSEDIGTYKYELRDVWDALPVSTRQAMSYYRITNA